MTTEDLDDTQELVGVYSARMKANLARVEELTNRFISAISKKKPTRQNLQAPSGDLYLNALTAYVTEMLANPSKMIEYQVEYWAKSVKHYVEAQEALSQGLKAPTDASPADRRFSNPLWDSNPYFNFIKQQYLLNAEAIQEAVSRLDHLDPKEKRRVEYFSTQIVDLLCPTNYLGTNPDALSRAVETEGESLVRGLENLVADIEENDGDLLVTLSQKDAFSVGVNLATTPGKVVFRNRMFELLQYTPSTETVYRIPLVLFPPWINKFYALDLKEKNSLIKWVVDQGYTVFVISWINPDESYADVALDHYVQEGYLEAIKQVKKICNVPQVNAVGYCIAGTTLSITLALMKATKDKSVKSATLFTTLTDFSDQGEMAVFLDDDFVDGIEAECEETGILRSFFMTRTFSFLRSNDLVYGPAIRSYMMGQPPPAFDLLYWNGDGTNLPGKMAVQYLRELCQGDYFATRGFDVCGTRVRLGDVAVPLCAIACETDHIAAWKASYAGVQQMAGKNKTFILSQSGHIAGIVNPPWKGKYGHYRNPDLTGTADEWKEDANFVEGSWWPTWNQWLSKQSGKQVDARRPGDGAEVLADAPGTYVLK